MAGVCARRRAESREAEQRERRRARGGERPFSKILCKDTTKIAYMQDFKHFFCRVVCCTTIKDCLRTMRIGYAPLLLAEPFYRGDSNPSKTGSPRAPFRPLPQADTTVFTGFLSPFVALRARAPSEDIPSQKKVNSSEYIYSRKRGFLKSSAKISQK